MVSRALHAVAHGINRMALPIVLTGFILAVVSLLYAWRNLQFTGNPNDLVRSDAKYHKLYLDYTGQFRAEEDYVILVCGSDFEKNRACVEFIASKLRERSDLFKKIFYKIDFSELAQRGMLYLDAKQLQEIEGGIDDFAKLMGKDELKLDFTGMLNLASQRLDPKSLKKRENEAGMERFMKDFVGSLNSLADRLEQKKRPTPISFGNFLSQKAGSQDVQTEMAKHEYIALEEGRILLLQVPSPNKEATFGDHAGVITPLKAILDAARAKYPGLEIGLTGEPAMSEDESQSSTRDTTISSIITFILIALLFWFGYHEFTRPTLALLTLILAVCWSVGFTAFAIGHLNILSITFFPMILGLGIDFGIQILGRYEEELPRSRNVTSAIAQTISHTGVTIITGGSITAAAFYTMCLNDFRGLAEMGLISGTGILLCILANLILLPALLSLRDRHAKGVPDVPESQRHDKNEKLHFFDRLVTEHAKTIIVLSMLVTAGALSQFPKLWFDYNLLNLQNPTLESVRYEHRLLNNKDARSVIFAALVCDNLEEAVDRAEKLKKLPSVHEVVSVTEMVPKDQAAKLAIIARIKRKLESVKLPKPGVKVNVTENIQVLQKLRANCERMNKLAQKWASKDQAAEAQEFFGELIPPMSRALKVLSTMDQQKAEQILSSHQTALFGEMRKNLDWLKSQKVDRPITESDVPQALRERYLGQNGHVLLEIYPKENIWNREPLVKFVNQLRSVDDRVTGTPIQNYEYIELLRVSYEQAAVNALMAIVLLIILHFRTPKYVIPTLIPLALGMIWTAGLMPLIGLPFNPANIITLPLVIGVGVAYGVYAVDRYRENASPALFSTSTGKAIVLSALTTIFGFGSLSFASHQGIASLGRLMTIGVVMCLVTSLYVCPAILHVLGRRRMK